MPLEATVVCVDNSEWMRNGDYSPSRFAAQIDAVNMVCGAKVQGNPENTVAILTMAKRPDVVVSLTQDVAKILTCIHGVKIEGETNLLTSLQIAKLCLKHSANKHQRQRVIAFVGSPIEEDASYLVKIAKTLRKANVSVDIVSFGPTEENNEKLEKFIEAVNKDGSSHLLTVPSNSGMLTDMLVSSSILNEEGETSNFNEFGVDPNIDPDLAMVLRISAEEERLRQEALRNGGNTESNGNDEASAAMPVTEESNPMAGMSEEEQMALALQMSMADEQSRQNEAENVEANDGMQVESEANDEAFLNSVLSNLPGAEEEQKEE